MLHPLAMSNCLHAPPIGNIKGARGRKHGGAERTPRKSSDHLDFTPAEGPMGVACSKKTHGLISRRPSQYILVNLGCFRC